MRNDTSKFLTKSVPSPPAQYATLSQLRTRKSDRLHQFITCILQDQNLPLFLKAFILLLLCNGLRISELIQIKGLDVAPDGTVLIRSLKNSDNRFVQPIYFRNYFINLSGQPIYPLADFSRFYFYRLFKKKGIYIQHRDKSKTSVTHAARELYLKNLYALSQDTETVQRAIGHRNIKSTESYLNKK